MNIFWLIAAALFGLAACCFGDLLFHSINGYTFVAGGVSSIMLAVWVWPASVTARTARRQPPPAPPVA